MSQCPFDPVSLCPYVTMSLCPYVTMSLCPYVPMSLCPYVPMSLCPYVPVGLCPRACSSALKLGALLAHHEEGICRLPAPRTPALCTVPTRGQSHASFCSD